MSVYDLYGSRTLSMTEVRDAVEAGLNVRLDRRDSRFRAGDYFRLGLAGGEELVIHLNRDEDPEPLEAAFPDYAVLVRVDRSDRADELRKLLEAIPALDFLRRTVGTGGS